MYESTWMVLKHRILQEYSQNTWECIDGPKTWNDIVIFDMHENIIKKLQNVLVPA